MDLTRLRTLPSPDEIRQLPLFENIARQNIVLIQNLEQCLAIEAELKTAAVLGFDSESKPTFNVGRRSFYRPAFNSARNLRKSLSISAQ